MPLREFTDADHRVWQVWDTVPKNETEEAHFAHSARLGTRVRSDRSSDVVRLPLSPLRFTEGREHGWLTFMCADEKRRLSPIPDHWSDVTDADLAALLARAERVPRTVGLNL